MPAAVPALGLVDSLDGDSYLLLQPGAVRTVELTLSGADSLAAVDLYGAFPPDVVHVLAIREGELWDGETAASHSFSASIDSARGRFTIQSAMLGDAAGLTSARTRVVARLRVQADTAMAIPATGVIGTG